MSLWLQIKYLKFLPLEQFTDKGSHKWNFRCPVCGDSQKSEIKKRGWATEYKNNLSIKCFNCDYSGSFHSFLKNYFPQYYTDYIKEKYSTKLLSPKDLLPVSKIDIFADEKNELSLQKIKELPENHKAVLYLKNRQLPEKYYNEFYYSDNFTQWINTEVEKEYYSFDSELDRRIVIPFYDKYKKIFALQARTIDYAKPKYLIYKYDKECDLIYGLERIDFTKKVHVLEGMLDSLFLDNCLAVSGSLANIDKLLKYTSKSNIVVIPDNDFRNKYTDVFIERIIRKDYSVVLWPKGTVFKDINDAIKLLTKQEIFDIIELYTNKGLSALIKFKLRRL